MGQVQEDIGSRVLSEPLPRRLQGRTMPLDVKDAAVMLGGQLPDGVEIVAATITYGRMPRDTIVYVTYINRDGEAATRLFSDGGGYSA